MSSSLPTWFPADKDAVQIYDWFQDRNRILRVGAALRVAFDDVYNGAQTGRYSVTELDKLEKTYLGFRVEQSLLHELELPKSPRGPDTIINGVAVDVKFSLNSKWMIPLEAIGTLCLLCEADDTASTYSVGLLRCVAAHLTHSGNRDGKKQVSSCGRTHITWLARHAQLPPNLLLAMNPTIRDMVLLPTFGQQRVTQLFRQVRNTPISRAVVQTVGRQVDPQKRVRDARKPLRHEGIEILHVRNRSAKPVVSALGLPVSLKDAWISVRSTP